MPARLTLDRTGMKNPLDISTPVAPAPAPAPAPPEPELTPAPAKPKRRPSPSAKPAPRPPAKAVARGYRVQTSIRFDAALLDAITELAHSADVSFTSLLIAILEAGLPTETDTAAQLAVSESAEHPKVIRVEQNIRLPHGLRQQLDTLTAPYERRLRGARSMLVSALLRAGMPTDTAAAVALADDHLRRQRLQALAPDA